MDNEEKNIIRTWAGDSGITLPASKVDAFGIYLDELWEWNKKVNLTGLSSRKKIVTELLLDSIFPLPFLLDEGRFLDVGSGAGFPGIPLKICKPGLNAHFMEANSKKVSFLKHVIRLTSLRAVEDIRGRIEKDKGLLHPEGYHVITVRAVAHLRQALTWCAPHLVSGGLIVNFQGARFQDALNRSSNIIKDHRLFLSKSVSYALPGKDSPRRLLIFKKQKP